MATTRLMPLHAGKGRNTGSAIRSVIGYVSNPGKTRNGELVTGFACDPRTADGEFLLAKREYLLRTGRARGKDDVIAYHLRQSFFPGEVTPEQANQIGRELASRFTHGQHAFLVATHTDKRHTHNHIIIHAVNLDCDRKFRNFWGSTKAIQRLSDTLCVEHGLSIVEHPQGRGRPYNQWLGDQAQPSQREELRSAIDRALLQKPADFAALLALLRKDGWEVKPGKHCSLRRPGQARFKRLDSLGDGYTEDALRAVLAETKTHCPQGKTIGRNDAPFRLLVDIQAKLRVGKGVAYECWAKKFNLKQAAQTLNYLSEKGITAYDDLKARTEEATARYHALSSQVREQERRLKEIATLRTHILNYLKTRETYIDYRKAGYARKFLAEHEQEILLHKAAKQAFDALGVTKLPTLKSLQAEYATVLTERRAAYAQLRPARDDMRQLLMAKANVEQILGYKDTQKRTRQLFVTEKRLE